MSLRFSVLLLIAFIVATSMGHEQYRGPRSGAERALFGYATADDCLFGSSAAFLHHMTPSTDKKDDANDAKNHESRASVTKTGDLSKPAFVSSVGPSRTTEE